VKTEADRIANSLNTLREQVFAWQSVRVQKREHPTKD
jgi:hypothetical protein